ncbi:MAG: NAD(P)H-dependent oxidoreductase [Bacteroidia bacterium]|nr:NAD(P)H-dependent oxidoreductase [Bacteroidia bacterium]MBT8278856.1 NAD(P)H-dependent oxidoreductase [Bacteroidia bacterium]NND25922.1 NAD(P)H-dependent oxidoreductase [Flavobacteriaceae bacterium]NNK60761.1 NAD(P)H-dependent oxidoreductase [Flavobacteriaceae bacterium]NNL33548.1 NAD(P)H-dependent oxidoreductase [Flavobacteriaceae bacterium]
MKTIIAFGGSNSKTSINKQLAMYAASMVDDVHVKILDLNDFKLPLYGIDLENEQGIPDNANEFLNLIKAADGIVLSLAEHNGAYSTAFKNIFDWMSRIDGKLWSEKPMLLMATSPGGRGGASVLEIAKNRFPYMGGNIVADFSLPSFNKNFSKTGIEDDALESELKEAIKTFKNALN